MDCCFGSQIRIVFMLLSSYELENVTVERRRSVHVLRNPRTVKSRALELTDGQEKIPGKEKVA